MKHTCEDCEEYKEIEPLEETLNRQSYYICEVCNEIRNENFISDYY